jgi:hypothetical protein
LEGQLDSFPAEPFLTFINGEESNLFEGTSVAVEWHLIDVVYFLYRQRQGGSMANSISSASPLPVRTAVRFPIRLDVVLRTADREYVGVTEDISANGILFVSEELPPMGASIEFRLNMPAEVMGSLDDVVRHTEVEGRTMAAAVIDEYALKAEQG